MNKNWRHYTGLFCNGFVFTGFLFSAIAVLFGEAPTKLSYVLVCITGALEAAELVIRDYEDNK